MVKRLSEIASRFSRFLAILTRNQRGSVLVLWAFAAVPVVLGVGTVVDVSRAYMARSRLAFALDAAGLAAGAAGSTEAEIKSIAEQYFFANYSANSPGTPSTPTVAIDGGVITVSESVTVETTIMQLIGQGEITVTASAEILRKGLEVVLILVLQRPVKGGKLESLRGASQDLVDILFQVPELQANLKVGIVPYSASVNVGGIAPSVVTAADAATYDPTDNEAWNGCVLGRSYPNDVEDIPFSAGNEWPRYFWDSAQDNVWPVVLDDPDLCNSSTGPDLGCPTPVVPLTANKATLDAAVGAMEAWCRGGTFSNIGMMWGWRVLSPDAPFSEGLPYQTPGYDKVAILMTDGVNGYFTAPGSDFSADYAGYGRLHDGSLGTTKKNAAKTILNNRLSEVCENMKSEGIIIYTVTFQLNDNNTKQIYENCASEPDKYFDSGNGTALQTAFKDIAEQLINLRVSK
ncbi:MAG: pilus assembly protein TadG-related protein [Proteobacteria bacterium]|nr:pilus assembly protein TadG-related protein [Pseudomonadota bacterium]